MTYDSVDFIVKIALLELALRLSASAANKTQYFAYLSFNSTLQLINGIASGLQKLLTYFNDTSIVAIFRILLAPTVFPNNLVL